MRGISTSLAEVVVIEPETFNDVRESCFETDNQWRFAEAGPRPQIAGQITRAIRIILCAIFTY
jgi:dTDP-4-dehydrorhamnose 3,5-epimerase-like enzyme